MKSLLHAAAIGFAVSAIGCATPVAPGAEVSLASAAGPEGVSPVQIRGHAPVDHKAQVTARMHQSVGSRHLEDGKVALAIRELRAAEELNPADKWIQLTLAEAYRRRGLVEDAESHLLTSLAIDPDFQEARLTLSGLYVQAERYEEAIVQTEWLVNDPTFGQPWLALTNQGFAESKLGRSTAARKSLQLATEYHDRYWRAFLNLAILDAEEGKQLDAIERLEYVTSLEPGPLGTAEANYRLAEIYVSFGNRDEAITHFDAAASQRPSGIWGKKSEDYLKRLR